MSTLGFDMKRIFLFFIILAFVSVKANAQQDSLLVDTLKNKQKVEVRTDTTAKWVKNEKIELDDKKLNIKPKFKPDPKKAVIYSAIFPGLGQMYNRKYWKLPIIYGGFLGLSYGISWNGQYYGDYKDAYNGIIAEDFRSNENFNKWKDMAPSRMRTQNISDTDAQWLRGQFKRKKDVYRRNRDLCIIGAIGVYALCMIDAYVDAHLFDFDISQDLSLKVEPAVMPPTAVTNRSVGVQCSVKF